MIELLQWVHLSDEKVKAVQSLSNILIFLYVIASMINKQMFFLFAFLVVEAFGNLIFFKGLSDIDYYLVYAAIYCWCYWFCVVTKCNTKIAIAYGIMVLFQMLMAADAYIFQGIETLIYSAYEYVVLAIHLYIIAMLIQWRALIRALGAIARSIANFLNLGYAFAFCYNAYILHNKK
tara:strand:+ start:2804 stop:3334 length:531 start_codon:yes stop_codon:yes gene_type:complete